MKKSICLIASLSIILFLSSCSSVKVLDSWKADNVKSINDKNILVIARTQNKQARIAFENEIVKQLTARGMNALIRWETTFHISKVPFTKHSGIIT